MFILSYFFANFIFSNLTSGNFPIQFLKLFAVKKADQLGCPFLFRESEIQVPVLVGLGYNMFHKELYFCFQVVQDKGGGGYQ